MSVGALRGEVTAPADRSTGPVPSGRVRPDARPSRVPALLACTALLGLVAVLVTLVAADAGPQPVPAGLSDPGPLTGWGLPVLQALSRGAAALVVGSLLVAAVLVPGPVDRLSATGYRATLTAGWAAAGWAATSAGVLLLQMSDVVGVPVAQLLDLEVLVNYLRSVPQGQAVLVTATLAVVLAVACRQVLSRSGCVLLLALALLALVPPALTGHAAGSANHDIATSALVLHVLASAVWVGGLAAVVLHLRRSGPQVLGAALRVFSPLALACVVALTVSGVVSGWTRLPSVDALVGTGYGRVVLVKAVLLVGLVAIGARHRRGTLGQVALGDPRAFRRWALGEVAVMAVAFGVGSALPRVPTPTQQDAGAGSAAAALLGYDVPPLTAARLLTQWRPDLLVLALAVLAAVLYVRGVLALRRAGTSWPWWRSTCWLLGVTLGAAVMVSGVASYAMAMFSMHMLQHMVLTMVVPVLLAFGAPLTLSLRALPARPADGPRGARELLLAVLHSGPARVLTHPLVTVLLYVTSLYGLYFTPLFESTMRTHVLHLLVSGYVLLVGLLFFWPILGADPYPRGLSHPARLMLLLLSLPLHLSFGLVLLAGTDLIAPSWYAGLGLPWVDRPADQKLAGIIAWAAGGLSTHAVLVAMLPQWAGRDRAGRGADRPADTDAARQLPSHDRQLASSAARDRSPADA